VRESEPVAPRQKKNGKEIAQESEQYLPGNVFLVQVAMISSLTFLLLRFLHCC